MRVARFVRMLSVLSFVLSLFFAQASATMAKPTDNGGPGNSGAAKMCQKGGWSALARSEAPAVGFANQDECVSYGAEGGTLVGLISIAWTFVSDGGTCTASFEIVNLQPNTTYYYTTTVNSFVWNWYQEPITTDGNGTLIGPVSTWSFSGSDVPIGLDINSSDADPHAYRVLTSYPTACPSS